MLVTTGTPVSVCGDSLHHADNVSTPAGWTLCYALETDVPDITTVPCNNLLVNIQGGQYLTDTDLVGAGGSFGCYKSSSGPSGVNVDYACTDGYQQTTYLKDRCSHCNTIGVCIRVP